MSAAASLALAAALQAPVAFLGDVDGNDDGRSEVAIGAPRGPRLEGARGFSERGAVYLYTAGHFAHAGPGGSDRFGYALSSPGDVDCGRVWIVRGPTGAGSGATCLVEVFGEGAFDRLGTSIAPLGDLDGNGRTDVAIGAPSFPFRPGDDLGRIYLLLR